MSRFQQFILNENRLRDMQPQAIAAELLQRVKGSKHQAIERLQWMMNSHGTNANLDGAMKLLKSNEKIQPAAQQTSTTQKSTSKPKHGDTKEVNGKTYEYDSHTGKYFLQDPHKGMSEIDKEYDNLHKKVTAKYDNLSLPKDVKKPADIDEEVKTLLNDTSGWGSFFRDLILGKATRRAIHHKSMYFKDKKDIDLPREIKIKYPDLSFALDIVTKHQAMERYFDNWDKALEFINYKEDKTPITVYRGITFTSYDEMQGKLKKVMDDIKAGNSLKSEGDHKTTSFSQAENEHEAYHIANNVMTGGAQLPTIIVKKKVVPVFNVNRFWNYIETALEKHISDVTKEKEAQKENMWNKRSILSNPVEREKEIIAPNDPIERKDILGVATAGSHLDKIEDYGKEVKIQFTDDDNRGTMPKKGIVKSYTISEYKNSIKYMKDAYEKYGSIDVAFGNKWIVTSNPKESHYTRYVGSWRESTELSKELGVKVYTGVW